MKIFCIVLGFYSILIFSSCSSTRDFQVRVRKPAAINLPSSISKIVIVRRINGSDKVSVIRDVLKGELPATENALSQRCISGLFEALTNHSNFKVSLAERMLKADIGSTTGFRNPLDWSVINEIARENNADAVLCLEYLNTDYSFTITQLAAASAARGTNGLATAMGGFRLYDINSHTILFEKSIRRQNQVEKKPGVEQIATNVLDGPEILQALSYDVGESLAFKLISNDVWESRLMFKGGSSKNLEAQRLVITQNWQQGVDKWLEAYKEEAKPEEKGNIAYNLGLGYEVLGNLAEAKKWVTKSYLISGNNRALAYSNILDRRIQEDEILKERNQEQN